MTKKTAYFAAAAFILCAIIFYNCGQSPKRITQWPGMPVERFGCMVEKSLGYRDKKFNCDLKNYENHGDPCQNTGEYYEGITLPVSEYQKINPHLINIQLNWEHGKLQSVMFAFDRKFSPAELTKIFHLPAQDSLPANITYMDIQDCTLHNTCLLLQAFDHIGAGDADCPNTHF